MLLDHFVRILSYEYCGIDWNSFRWYFFSRRWEPQNQKGVIFFRANVAWQHRLFWLSSCRRHAKTLFSALIWFRSGGELHPIFFQVDLFILSLSFPIFWRSYYSLLCFTYFINIHLQLWALWQYNGMTLLDIFGERMFWNCFRFYKLYLKWLLECIILSFFCCWNFLSICSFTQFRVECLN